MPKARKNIQSLERGFLILELLSMSESPLSLQTISNAIQLNKTTVHGLLATLHSLGYVSKHNHSYSLGFRCYELSKPIEQKKTKLSDNILFHC